MLGLFLLWLLLAGAASAAGPSDIARLIRESGLDPEQCYRVRELNFAKEEFRIYLTAGYLIFGKPVAGNRIAAVFSADVEGGDAELILMPPYRSERLSLATFTGSPNFNEHFKAAVMIFTDETFAELSGQIHAREEPRKSQEMGLLLARNWNPVVLNLCSSFEVRLVQDLLSRRPASDFFFSSVSGNRLGNFDLLFDPRAREQIVLGKLAFRENRTFFDFWASFQSRSFREGTRKAPDGDFKLGDFRIEAVLGPDLRLRATTRATLTPTKAVEPVLPFELSRQMQVTAARIDGAPVEVFVRESLRANQSKRTRSHSRRKPK